MSTRARTVGAPPVLRLVFQLPASWSLVRPGPVRDTRKGTTMIIEPGGRCVVTGHVRSVMFDTVADYLRIVARRRPSEVIDAIVCSPPGHWPGGSGRDSWTIICNADVAFSPTRGKPEIPEPVHRPPTLTMPPVPSLRDLMS